MPLTAGFLEDIIFSLMAKLRLIFLIMYFTYYLGRILSEIFILFLYYFQWQHLKDHIYKHIHILLFSPQSKFVIK